MAKVGLDNITAFHTYHRKPRRRPYVKPGHEWAFEIKRAARQNTTSKASRGFEMRATEQITGATPLVEKAQTALDVTYAKMAEITGHRDAYLRGMDHVPLDRDAILERVLAYTNERIGMLLALRLELQRELSNSRKARFVARLV